MAMRQVKFGVLGAGGIACRKTIPAMLRTDNCRLAAVMAPVHVEVLASRFGGVRAYRNAEELVADPEVEAVYIASPVACHAEQIRLAAAAGKHILCEKPLTLGVKQAEECVALCRRHKVFLQEGYMMKFHGAHAKIKELVDAGRLGKLVSMRAQLSCWYPRIEGAWRQDPASGGGGALIDMASHLYDLLEHFAGPVRRVAALTGNLVQDYRSEDASTTLLQFESGAHATVDCFFCIPDEASQTRLEIYGSRGAILAEGTIGQSTGGKLEGLFRLGDSGYDTQQNKDVAPSFQAVPFEPIDPYEAECAYFAECVTRARPLEINDGENALRILRIVEAAYESSRTGRFVTVS